MDTNVRREIEAEICDLDQRIESLRSASRSGQPDLLREVVGRAHELLAASPLELKRRG